MMANVIYTYKGRKITIQSNFEEKLKEINKTFLSKLNLKDNDIFFIYNGSKINDEFTLEQQASNMDKNTKEINILVYDIEDDRRNNIIIIESIIKSKQIICPECSENILMKIHDYKINLYDCKNDHKQNDILISNFDNTQTIDLSKIVCSACGKNKSQTYGNQLFICTTCSKNLCPLCKSIHDKSHKIINYEDKNYICRKHNSSFIKYCKQCRQNICMQCNNEHKNHNSLYLLDLFVEKENILKETINFKNSIDKLKDSLNQMIKIINNVKDNIDKYYKIYNDLINNYDMQNINYEILHNIIFLNIIFLFL